jgi:hypothetical protein
MNQINTCILILFIVVLVGLYVYKTDDVIIEESFKNNNKCPNLLIQKDNKIYLFNSNNAEIPGVNPIEFRNLEEYSEFYNWQKSQNISCPVLFLQKAYDVQGNRKYRVRPSPFDHQGGLQPIEQDRKEEVHLLLDSNRDDEPFNDRSISGFDPKGQHVGEKTPLDILHDTGKYNNKNPNAMDTNWHIKN